MQSQDGADVVGDVPELAQGPDERDPLLGQQRTDGGKNAGSRAQRSRARGGFPPLQTLVLAVVGPWASFLLFSGAFLLFSHAAPVLTIILASIIGGICLVGSILSRLSDTPAVPLLLFLCALGVTAGSVVGSYNYYYTVHYYYIYQDHREYTNVWPDEPADAHRDAAALVFTKGARPDRRLPMRYLAAGRTYCVAPVLMTRDNSTDVPRIEYFAVGRDCCEHRDFVCDDAAKPTARAGFVLHTGATPLQHLHPSDLSHYLEAVKMAEAKFDLHVAPNPILVRWVQDLDAVLDGYWDMAWTFHLEAGLAHLAFSVLVAVASPELGAVTRRAPSWPAPKMGVM